MSQCHMFIVYSFAYTIVMQDDAIGPMHPWQELHSDHPVQYLI
jgi:hypothetical protein